MKQEQIPKPEVEQLARRAFFTSTSSGLGFLAASTLLQRDGFGRDSADDVKSASQQSNFASAPHFEPKAKQCIFVLPEGAPSQIDLFDPKPKLMELDKQPLPKELLDKVRFAFIQKESAVLMGCGRKFAKHGESGMELSELLPHLATCADDLCLIRSMHTDSFNHHPAQLMLNSGVPRFGRPSMGSWITYGLGSESQNLPAYVVLTAGRGGSGGVSNWTSGFLPSSYEGVLFRNQGDPILNLSNPIGIDQELQRESLNALSELNQLRFETHRDDEIQSRIKSYELAFKMQMGAPELLDLSQESKQTLEEYGVNRKEPDKYDFRGGGPNVYRQFATNCLLARRMIERGVRFVTLIHASWDHHSNIDPELAYNAGMADQPLAALLKDLKRRGLLDSTLVVFAGEFGRTPLGENRKGREGQPLGRDHHPYAFSVWMSGGGFKGGLTYGATDEIGWAPIENPVHIHDFHATILHQFGLNHLDLNYRYAGLNVRLTDQGGKVVHDLLT